MCLSVTYHYKNTTFFKLIILKQTTVKRSSHLGCGFNEKMAHKVAGRILKRLFFFIVLQISCFIKSSATLRLRNPDWKSWTIAISSECGVIGRWICLLLIWNNCDTLNLFGNLTGKLFLLYSYFSNRLLHYTLRSPWTVIWGGEYWMIFRGPGFFAVEWFGSSSSLSLLLPSVSSTGDTQEERQLCWLERG